MQWLQEYHSSSIIQYDFQEAQSLMTAFYDFLMTSLHFT